MGSFVEFDISQGKIQRIDAPGGGFYDLKGSTVVRVEAPKPFWRFSRFWQIWNANWFVNFSTTAQKINWFYEHSGGSTVDGIITLTPDVVVDLLRIVGPLEMSEYGKVLTADNFYIEVQKAVEFEYDKEVNEPKGIIRDAISPLLGKLFELEGKEFIDVLRVFGKGLNNKNILIHSFQSEEADLLNGWGWSGDVRQTSKDYVMVVNNNIGGGKTDVYIRNEADLKTEVDERGNIYNTLVYVRRHDGRKGKMFEDQNNVAYTRFYVPQGSELVLADNFDSMPLEAFKAALVEENEPEKDEDLARIEKDPIVHEQTGTRITQEFGKTCFGNWMMVEPGETKVVTIKYKLPFKFSQIVKEKGVVASWFDGLLGVEEPKQMTSYSILIQKQPGDMNTEFKHDVLLPQGWQIVDHLTNSGLEMGINQIEFSGNLEEDRFFGVVLGK